MTLTELYTICSAVLPTTYLAWPEGEAPPLPWLAIVERNSDNFAADGIVYSHIKSVDVELYTLTKSPETEASVEEAFLRSGVFWEKSEEYIESEKCYQITYSLEV